MFYQLMKRSFFKNLVRFLRLDIEIFDRIHFDNMIKACANEMKQHVFKNLKPQIKISIVCDVWINLNHLTFLKIIVYFINKNWRYREIFIAFKSLQNFHNDKKLIQTILNILIVYDLQTRLMIVIVDNVKNNVFLRFHLFEKLAAMNIEWNNESDIIDCMIHVMQLIVNALLKHLNVQIRNDDMIIKFDENDIKKIIDISSLKNTIKKINRLIKSFKYCC